MASTPRWGVHSASTEASGTGDLLLLTVRQVLAELSGPGVAQLTSTPSGRG
jgi:hypothetical protein